jgi:Domain of unknown function (DUF5753)
MVAQREPYEFPAIRAFATELAAWRDTMSKVELTETLGYTPQLIGQLEAGKNIPSKKFAEDTDTLFKTNGLFVRLWKLITDTRHLAALPPGFSEFVELERRASAIRVFGLLLITGLLQTEEYAREILLTIQQPDVVDQFVASRMERQAIFTRDKPPRLWATLDERALHCMVGRPDVMRAQLEFLLEASRRPNVMIEVVPRPCPRRSHRRPAAGPPHDRQRPRRAALPYARRPPPAHPAPRTSAPSPARSPYPPR